MENVEKTRSERHAEFVKMVDELLLQKSCHKTQLAIAGGFTPNNFMSYYTGKKAVSQKTLNRVKALYSVPINRQDTILTSLEEHKQILAKLDEIKLTNQRILEELLKHLDILSKIEK